MGGLFDESTRVLALDVYQREGATAAAEAAGVTTRTVFRWAREAGVSSGWENPSGPQTGHGTATRYRTCRCDDCMAANAAVCRARRHDDGCDCLVCRLAARARDGAQGITADEWNAPEVRALDGRRRERPTPPEVEPAPEPPTLTVAPEPEPEPEPEPVKAPKRRSPVRLPDEDVDAILKVARRHGTGVAAEWANVGRHTVAKLRREHDGYVRGQGHPSKAEIAARAPSLSCLCPRCDEWRAETHATTADGAESEGWWAAAACRGRRIEIFFPERGDTTRPAKELCAGCPVRDDCLDYALANGIKHGIWGGTSEKERRTPPTPPRRLNPTTRHPRTPT